MGGRHCLDWGTAAASIFPMAPLRDSDAPRGATVPFCLHHGGGRGSSIFAAFGAPEPAQGSGAEKIFGGRNTEFSPCEAVNCQAAQHGNSCEFSVRNGKSSKTDLCRTRH